MSKCLFCDVEIRGVPFPGDKAHWALETCVANLKARVATLEASMFSVPQVEEPEPGQGRLELVEATG